MNKPIDRDRDREEDFGEYRQKDEDKKVTQDGESEKKRKPPAE
jgi:hypothetical protein